MPVSPTYPGVYVEELPSPVKTIIGVETSVAAFVGPAQRGPVDEAIEVTSLSEYQAKFGEQHASSLMSYAVPAFFLNGGRKACIVRVAGEGAAQATVTLGSLTLRAANWGEWGNGLRIRVYTDGVRQTTKQETDAGVALYNLTVRDTRTKAEEQYRNIPTSKDSTKDSPQSLDRMLKRSALVAVDPDKVPADLPTPHQGLDPRIDPWTSDQQSTPFTGGVDVVPTRDSYWSETGGVGGVRALLKLEGFNILCVPDIAINHRDLMPHCLAFCHEERAMLIVDPPKELNLKGAQKDVIDSPLTGPVENAAMYWPWPTVDRVINADTTKTELIPPSGAVAGVWARTDVARGVWKAPAGVEAGLTGVTAFTEPMTDMENGELNPLGVNCLRKMPIYGPLVWGARTLDGADYKSSQWKYIPVRRLALYIEESLFRGTKWVVFEPNDEPLWSSIRLNVGAFMHGLFRQGAFQGATPQKAYFVKCDADNNPQEDIDRGIVTVRVGFAPLKPAEFVILQIQQISPLTSTTS